MPRDYLYQQVLNRYPSALSWLEVLGNLGRAPATLEAYGRGLAHFLSYCESSGWHPYNVSFEQTSLYIRQLLPGGQYAVANATLHQRMTAIRLWYDHLVYAGFSQSNPLPRGQRGRWFQFGGYTEGGRGLRGAGPGYTADKKSCYSDRCAMVAFPYGCRQIINS